MLSELLYADDLVLINETAHRLGNKFRILGAAFVYNSKSVNLGKPK